MRYSVIIALFFMIGKELIQSIRQKTVDWYLLAVIVLPGITIHMSRSFLVTGYCYDYSIICIVVLSISAYLFDKSKKVCKLVRSLAIASLLVAISVFTYWNIKAKKLPCKIDIVELNGFTRWRTDEVLFKYDGESFNRHCSLNDYSSHDDLMELYNVKLMVKPLYPHIVKLESITLIPKK